MIRFINMPKLVAHYLREFSIRADGEPSNLYKFVFCLCLPFLSAEFRRARLIAQAIAECTNSEQQIVRLLAKITGATVTIDSLYNDLEISYDDTEPYMIAYDGSADTPIIPYTSTINEGVIYIVIGNATNRDEIEAYLALLTPFYVKYRVVYEEDTQP